MFLPKRWDYMMYTLLEFRCGWQGQGRKAFYLQEQ